MKKNYLIPFIVLMSLSCLQAQEMIVNGTFDADSSGWIVEDEHGADLSLEIVDGAAHFTVEKTGLDPWNNQFKQHVTVVDGKKYDVSFDMKAVPFVPGDAVGISIYIQKDSPDWDMCDERIFYPTTEWQTFAYTSNEWEFGDTDEAKISFVFTEAYPGDEVWIDNVSMSEEGTLVAVENDFARQMSKFSLSQNYPNPFNPETAINFELPTNEYVSLKIYDVSGRLIKTLASHEMQAGSHSFNWDSRNEAGRQAPSGIYFYTIQAGAYNKTVKMTLLK